VLVFPRRGAQERARLAGMEIAGRSFPQATLLAGRWGLLEGLDQRMEFTAQRDVRTLKEVAGDAEQAPARFTSAGRGG
jgi:hypothetical protein